MSAQPKALRLAEPVAWVNASNLLSAAISRQRGGPFDQHTWSEQQTDYHDTPLCAAAELRRLHAVNAQMLEALEWVKSQGFAKYYHRNKHNVEFCNAVDRFNAAIAAAKEQA